MIPGRNKPHILPGYKPADLYSPLIRIRRVTIFIVVNYKEGKLAAVVFSTKKATRPSENSAVTVPIQLSGSVIS